MAIMASLSDSAERERAAATFGRNVVVTAGAGTGKTTLLVDRIVHLLIRQPGPLKITEIVALTFTNKAANELKARLRDTLHRYLSIRLDKEPEPAEQKLYSELRSIMGKYHLAKRDIDLRVEAALRHMERSEIGTIHSFAASLLRLYPLEAGLDPHFREDDGTQLERAFAESWALWLDQELSSQAPRKDEWKKLLKRVSLEEIRKLALAICSENVPLELLRERDAEIPAPVSRWLKELEQRAAAVLDRHRGEKNQNYEMARTALKIIQDAMRGKVPSASEELLKKPRKMAGWDEEELGALCRLARSLLKADERLLRSISNLLLPFAESFRERFVREGFVSFDALLVRARDLVRDHPTVREELKRQFKAILIDEFQDTDPVQYEILLYLAEEAGSHARTWREVKLAPGKIFVVGDPKQSIYAFRRADIQAYLEVVREIIQGQDGLEFSLSTNFRSHSAILDPVNGLFERLIRPREGLQPAYAPIHPAPSDSDPDLPLQKIILRRVEAGEKTRADVLQRLEAESLARWLSEEILWKAKIPDRNGNLALVEPKDVAILLRKLTEVHLYLEALRRRGIRYVVEGERHFFAAQEVIDAVNLLRAVDNPYDRAALLGLLRSPAGGLKDADIYELSRRGLLDYRAAKRAQGRDPALAPVRELYAALDELHAEARRLPVGEAVERIFESIPILLLAAGSYKGEQAVANLQKVSEVAERMGREGLGTLKEVIALLERHVLQVKEEGESALAEENVDAVRVLSVHKAKGLEFPVVILAGCHAPISERDDLCAEYDWSSGLLGLQVAGYRNFAGVFLAERSRIRREEEEKRVLYVAMTRAREHLTISCASDGRPARGSFLSMIEECLGDLAAGKASVPAGKGSIELQIVRENLKPPAATRKKACAVKPLNWDSYVRLWRRRAEDYEAAMASPLFLSPTLLKEREVEEETRKAKRRPPSNALLIGELAHRFLEGWEFQQSPQCLGVKLRSFLDQNLATLEDRNGIEQELEEILTSFFSSASYREIGASEILGREVPLLMPWDGTVMEGVIDLIYRNDGRLYLADYKTDRISEDELPRAIENYRHQVEIYSEAARRVLIEEPASFKLIFLRLGRAIEVPSFT